MRIATAAWQMLMDVRVRNQAGGPSARAPPDGTGRSTLRPHAIPASPACDGEHRGQRENQEHELTERSTVGRLRRLWVERADPRRAEQYDHHAVAGQQPCHG